jgi:hypothetical protein
MFPKQTKRMRLTRSILVKPSGATDCSQKVKSTDNPKARTGQSNLCIAKSQ